MSSVPDFELISTTRYAPSLRDVAWNTEANAGTPSPYLLLSYHRDRLLTAAKAHNWSVPEDFSLDRLKALYDAAVMGEGSEWPEGNFRIRILLSFLGSLSITASPISPPPDPDVTALSLWLPTPSSSQSTSSLDKLDIFLDTTPTPSSPFTRTKTTRRDHYTAARGRFDIPPPPTSSPLEVLLFNEQGAITETSIRNIAFARRSPPQWVTPSASTGCLPGVMRRWLLEQGRVVEAAEGELTRDRVVEGEIVLTFNGVEGCRLGQVKIKH